MPCFRLIHSCDRLPTPIFYVDLPILPTPAFQILTKTNFLGESGIPFRIGRFPGQTPLSTWLGFGTQRCYKAPSDLRVEISKNLVMNITIVRLPPQQCPKSWSWDSQIKNPQHTLTPIPPSNLFFWLVSLTE